MALLRSLVFVLVMAITVIPYTLGILLVRVLGGSSAARYAVARAWLRLMVGACRWVLGIRVRYHGLEHVPQGAVPAGQTGAVLLSKHQSAYETFLLPAILSQPLAFVFKKELLKIPFFGWSIGSLDMIHIDRSQGARALIKVLQQGRRLLEKGTWVIMFPEGTRVPRGQQGKYMSSGARLAIDAGAPVVPVAVTSARVWPAKGFTKQAGVVEVSFGAPIPTQGRKADELMQQVQTWIEAEMRRLDPDAYPAAMPPAQGNGAKAD